jgi:hypothetical protein
LVKLLTKASSRPQKASHFLLSQKNAPLFAAAYAVVPGGYAAGNRGADYVKYLAPALAPEQGT